MLYIVSLYVKDIPVITNIIAVTMLVIALCNGFTNKFHESFKNNKVNTAFLLFFLVQLISVFFSIDKKEGVALIIQRIPMLLFPLAFSFIQYKNELWNKLLLFYAIVTTVASVAGFSFGVYNAINLDDTGFFYNDNISGGIGKQAVYFAFYVSIAILIFIDELQKNNFKQKPIILLFMLWLFFILFMLASRIAMFAILLILFYYVVSIILKRKKYLEGFLVLFGVIVGIVIIGRLFPKTFNRFSGTTEIHYQFDNKNVENHFNSAYDSTKWNGTNTRIAIWTCAYEVWKSAPIIGTGLGDRNKRLMQKFNEKQFLYAIATNKNSHNQYIDILVSMGIVGLLLFLILYFIYPVIILLKNKQNFALQVLFLLAICLFTENMFDRYQGLIFVPFIISLAVKKKSIGTKNETL